MAPNQQRKRAEDAEKSSTIERIKLRLEELGRELWPERTARLKGMTRDELQQLAQRLNGAVAAQEATTMIVEAITASDKALRDADHQKHGGSVQPMWICELESVSGGRFSPGGGRCPWVQPRAGIASIWQVAVSCLLH